METRKLYYEDCHLTRFTARVLQCRQEESRFQIVLDQTAFYPEGGGQPADTGLLGAVRVLDVQEKDGQIVHTCDGALEVGASVEGVIDYEPRFDRMQQHTGEHILTGILHRRYGCHNVGFHMGKEVMEVDFDCLIPQEDIPGIEEEVNQAIWANLPLKCWIPQPEELKEMIYRSKRELAWPVRIVQVPGHDCCACCGVHVAMTGEVGIVKILSCVKLRQGVRMEVVCGSRAYRYLCAVWEQNRQVSQAFSAKELETAAAAVKMNEVLAAEKYRATGLQNLVFDQIAESYVNQERALHFIFDPVESSEVRLLADKIAEKCTTYGAVFAQRSDGTWSYCIISRSMDLRELGKRMTGALNGRGGGKPEFQQGSVRATREEIQEFFDEV